MTASDSTNQHSIPTLKREKKKKKGKLIIRTNKHCFEVNRTLIDILLQISWEKEYLKIREKF